MNVFKTKTPAGKPKIVDYNGFSIATAPDATKESEQNIERLVLCYNLLKSYTIEELKFMPDFIRN